MRRALLGLVLLVAGPAWAEPLLIGTEGAYPPYTFLTEAGEPQGLDIDLGNEVCARLETRCEWTVRPWADLLDGVVAGHYRVAIAAIADTPARREKVDFTRPYEPDPSPSIFVGWEAFADPDTSVIAVQAGTIHEDHLRETGRDLRPYPTARAAFDAMHAGETDLVFGSPAFLEGLVFRSSRALQIVAREQLGVGASAIAVAKGDPLRDRIDAVLREMIDDGTLDALRRRWLPDTEDI